MPTIPPVLSMTLPLLCLVEFFSQSLHARVEKGSIEYFLQYLLSKTPFQKMDKFELDKDWIAYVKITMLSLLDGKNFTSENHI